MRTRRFIKSWPRRRKRPRRRKGQGKGAAGGGRKVTRLRRLRRRGGGGAAQEAQGVLLEQNAFKTIVKTTHFAKVVRLACTRRQQSAFRLHFYSTL